MSEEIKSNNQNNISEKPGKTDFALAIKVSDRVQLESVMLFDCHCRQLRFIKAESRAFDINYSAESSMDTEAKRVIVLAKFKWEGFEADSKEKKQFATIEASFLLMYSAPSLEGINQENVEMFGNLNGIYNAWPYWREFLQNSIARMCLPPLTAPVFRLFPPKKEEATTEKKEGVVTAQEQS
ncbi:MAG: hypothetical protein ABSG22_10845 [Sedimentisphaerales bacterium]|jgi:hypothetical protein